MQKLSQCLCGNHSQKRLDHEKQSVTDAFKILWTKAIQKSAEPTGDLTGNKIADKIIGFSRTVKSKIEDEKVKRSIELPKERYIWPEKNPEVIVELRLK